MFVEGKSRTVFFPSDTLIYGISRDGSKNYNIRTCEHMILGQLRMGARQKNYAPLNMLNMNTTINTINKTNCNVCNDQIIENKSLPLLKACESRSVTI